MCIRDRITLLTDDFSTKLETMFPSIAALDSDEDMQVATAEESEIVTMEHGGVVNAAKIKETEAEIAELNAKLGPMPSGTRKQRGARQQIENQIRALQRNLQELRHPLPGKNKRPKKTKEVITPGEEEKEIVPEKEEKEIPETSTVTPDLRELLTKNAEAITNAALYTGKTKQGGISGFMDVVGQANLLGAKAERENLLKQLEIEGQTTALGDKYDEAAFASVVDQLDETGALEFYVLICRPLPKSRQGVIPAGKFNNRNFSEHLAFIRSTDKTTPFETIVANFRAKAA